MPGVEPEDVVKLLEKTAPGFEISWQSSKPLFTEPDHPLIQKLSALDAAPVGAPWFCDAAVFSAQGMAAVALGPGSIDQAHTADEWIKVSDLEAGADFFERFLRSLK